MLAERFRGTAEGPHLVSGAWEALSLTLRGIGRDDRRAQLHQAVDLYLCPETSHGIRREVVLKLGVVVGMPEAAMINQSAQEHALASALFAGLLGQLTPSFRRLPGRPNNLDEPTQGVGLDTIARAPSQVRRDQRAIARFACVVQRHDHAFGVVGAAGQSRTCHDGHDRFPAPDADVRRGSRRGRKLVGQVRRALVRAHGLRAADL
jgi:hypothetical protein